MVAPSRSLSPTFSGGELITAVSGALVVQGMMVVLLLAASASGKLKSKDEQPPEEVPMAVKPVADDLPLLKLGGAAPKLPDAWQKKAPLPVPAEPSDDGAPSPLAKDDSEHAAKKPLSRDAGPPAQQDASAARADDSQNAPDSGTAGEVVGPGAPNGSKNGTETDPLKARALDLYRAKLLAWFNVRFKPPQGIPCDELKKLTAGVSASVGGDRSVGGFTVTRSSGNDVFDAKVKSTMEGLVGQELPPPPQNYPDLDVGSLITPVFSGASASCVVPGGDAPGQSKPPPGTEKPAGDDKPAGGEKPDDNAGAGE